MHVIEVDDGYLPVILKRNDLSRGLDAPSPLLVQAEIEVLTAVHSHENDVIFFVLLALWVLLLSVRERVLA